GLWTGRSAKPESLEYSLHLCTLNTLGLVELQRKQSTIPEKNQYQSQDRGFFWLQRRTSSRTKHDKIWVRKKAVSRPRKTGWLLGRGLRDCRSGLAEGRSRPVR